jgi:SecD/SecF fusion protein
MFGSGPVQGFAVTLCIGIVTSLFTSIFITRLCIDWMLNHKKKINFSFPFSENFMRNANVDFIGKRKTFYIIAVCAVAICLIGIFARGLSRGIDFTGGRTYVVRFDQPVNAVEVRSALDTEFGEAPEVKTYGPSTQLKITTKSLLNFITVQRVSSRMLFLKTSSAAPRAILWVLSSRSRWVLLSPTIW